MVAFHVALPTPHSSLSRVAGADLDLDPAQPAALVRPILDGRTRVVSGSRFLAGRPAGPWMTVLGHRARTDMETCRRILAAGVVRGPHLEAPGAVA